MTLVNNTFIAYSIFCAVVVALLTIQKKGYLRYKIFTILTLLASILFFMFIGLVCHHHYYNYTSLIYDYDTMKKRYKKELKPPKFNEEEIRILESFHNKKTHLTSSITFLLESAQNYNLDDYSYEHLHKEDIIAEFPAKEYSLDYWQDISTILNSIYTKQNPYNIKENTAYYPITIVPSKCEINNQFQWQENN